MGLEIRTVVTWVVGKHLRELSGVCTSDVCMHLSKLTELLLKVCAYTCMHIIFKIPDKRF